MVSSIGFPSSHRVVLMVMVSWQCRRGGGARWRGGEGGVQVGADAVGTFRGGGGGHQHLRRVSDEGRQRRDTRAFHKQPQPVRGGRCWRARWPSRAGTGCCCGAPSRTRGTSPTRRGTSP